ncbi:MAG: hypothetical protein NTW62_02185 [Candidatus Nomurabacteria bacterium]|nr:hypothetical protein [Candidatus Nomurabacteria bacterium]
MPSKKIKIVLFIFIFLLVILFIFLKSSTKSSFFSKKDNLEVQNSTINDLIAKDTDGDGIPDWEESLWGTDKNKVSTFTGTDDKTYIENKKKELSLSNASSTDNLTETQKFSRDFFTAFMSMKTGQVDNTTINSFSAALGQKVADPNLTDQYTEKDLKLDVSGDLNKQKKYYMSIQSLFEQYQLSGLGDELDIVSQTLASGDDTNKATQIMQLLKISDAYKGFASKIMDLEVPEKLKNIHLRIANSSNNTGISVLNMSKIIGDPVVGLSGLSQYQKYSNDLIIAAGDLETTLPDNGNIVSNTKNVKSSTQQNLLNSIQ